METPAKVDALFDGHRWVCDSAPVHECNVSDSSWDSVKIKRANGDEETVPKERVERIAVCLLD